MSQATLEIRRISGHAGPVPGAGVERAQQVCKLVDTTTCIGCKACEVACLEWNGYTFSDTVFDNSYQTMPETAWNYWNLIKFNEHERARRHVDAADAQRPVHALRGAGLPGGLPGGWRDRPVCEWHRRFSAGPLHWLRVLRERMPVQYSEVQPEHEEDVQVHALLGPCQRRDWNRPASSPAPPAVSTSVRRTT